MGRLAPGRRRRSPADRFDDLLDHLFQDRIVDWSQADAQACARIMEGQRRRREPLDDHVPDAFLAAAATTRGLAIVTTNTDEFRAAACEGSGLQTGKSRPCLAGCGTHLQHPDPRSVNDHEKSGQDQQVGQQRQRDRKRAHGSHAGVEVEGR